MEKRKEIFNWVILSDLFPLNNPDVSNLLHRSSSSRSSPDISYSPFLACERCGSSQFWLLLISRSGNLDWWLCTFPFWQDRLWRSCQLLTLLRCATLTVLADPICLGYSAEGCAIWKAFRWSREHQKVYHFSSLLHLSDSCSVLVTLSSLCSFLSLQRLWHIW